MRRPKLESVATVMIIVAAAAVIRAQLGRSAPKAPKTTAASASLVPVFVPEWREFRSSAVLTGDSSAPIAILEFSDFECPFCARFHSDLAKLKQARGNDVAVYFVHYPLRQHRFARPAARASECADTQGRFMEFASAVFSKQDSLGLKTWQSFAVEAGIADTVRFDHCVRSTLPISRVDSGLALGARIGVRGTPTVIINGWRMAQPPYDSLSQVVNGILAGKLPGAVVPPVIVRRNAP